MRKNYQKCSYCNGKGKAHHIPRQVVFLLTIFVCLLPAIFIAYHLAGGDSFTALPHLWFCLWTVILLFAIYLELSDVLQRALEEAFVAFIGKTCSFCLGKGRIEALKTDSMSRTTDSEETKKERRITVLEKRLQEIENKLRATGLKKQLDKIIPPTIVERLKRKMSEQGIRFDMMIILYGAIVLSIASMLAYSVYSDDRELLSSFLNNWFVVACHKFLQSGLGWLSDALNLKKPLLIRDLFNGILLVLIVWLGILKLKLDAGKEVRGGSDSKDDEK